MFLIREFLARVYGVSKKLVDGVIYWVKNDLDALEVMNDIMLALTRSF